MISATSVFSSKKQFALKRRFSTLGEQMDPSLLLRIELHLFPSRNSNLTLLGKSLEIGSKFILLENSTLREPKQQALAGIYGDDETSLLEIKNVYLNDPSRGSLITGFGNVFFKNITVSLCVCNITKLVKRIQKSSIMHFPNVSAFC